MCYLDFCLKRKTLFLKVNNQSLKLPSFNYDMEFSSVQKFFHRTFSPSRNNLKRNLDFFPHIGVVTPSPSPLPLPVGVHEHIHFDWPRGEHCCQNSPAEYHFYKVILYPADHDETSRDPGALMSQMRSWVSQMVESWPRLHAAHAPPHYEQSALRNEFYFSHLEVAAVSTRLGCFSSVILKHKMFNSDLNSARALKPPVAVAG